MIGYNKIKKGIDLIKQGYTIYLAFEFTDGLYYYTLTETVNRKWIRAGGRKDRGRDEIKKYFYIPTKMLRKIENKKRTTLEELEDKMLNLDVSGLF